MKEKFKNILSKIKENKVKSIIAGIILLALLLGVSFAAFMVMREGQEKEVTYGTLDIQYIDGETISTSGQLPLTDDEVEEYASKTDFTVKNTGNVPVYLEVSLTNITMGKALKTNDFRYALYKEDTQIATGTFKNCGTELVLKNDILQYITDNEVKYTIALWIHDNGGNQNAMLNQSMSAKIKVKATDKKLVILPSEYQEIEYIESTGTQYIDTEVYGDTPNYRIVLDVETTQKENTNNSYYIGMYDGNTYYGLFGNNNNKYRLLVGKNTGNFSDNNYVLNERTKLEVKSQENNGVYTADLKINDITKTFTYTGYSNVNLSLYLFNVNYNNNITNEFGYFKLYSCLIEKNGDVVRNFIPCYRKSDNVVGLYDLVENKFYTNSGTGNFSKGPEL